MNLKKKTPGSFGEHVWKSIEDVCDVPDELALELISIGKGEYEHVVDETPAVKAPAKKAAAKKTAAKPPVDETPAVKVEADASVSE